MIQIICLGKIKEKYLEEMIEDYKKRINKYHKINIVELKDENDLKSESINILKHIKDRDFTIACDIKGEKLDSKNFADKLDSIFQDFTKTSKSEPTCSYRFQTLRCHMGYLGEYC